MQVYTAIHKPVHYFKTNLFVILNTHKYHFILKYYIFECICELHVLKFEWRLWAACSHTFCRYLPEPKVRKCLTSSLEMFKTLASGRYKCQFWVKSEVHSYFMLPIAHGSSHAATRVYRMYVVVAWRFTKFRIRGPYQIYLVHGTRKLKGLVCG